MILIPALVCSLVLAFSLSLVVRKRKKTLGTQLLVFILGLVLPFIDVPISYYLLENACQRSAGLKILREFDPIEGYYVDSQSVPSTFHLWRNHFKYVEFNRINGDGYRRARLVDGDIHIEDAAFLISSYEFRREAVWRPYAFGIVKSVSTELIDIKTKKPVIFVVGFHSTRPLGWLISLYFDAKKSCDLRDENGFPPDYEVLRRMTGANFH